MVFGLLSLLLWIVCGAFAPIVLKFAGHDVPPITLSFFRFLLATIVLFPFFILSKPKKLAKGHVMQLFGIGVLGSAINSSLYTYGIQSTSVILAQVLYATVPIIVALLSFIFHGEQLTKPQIFGAFVGFIGVLILVSESLFSHSVIMNASLGGNLLVVTSVFAWSLYTFLSKGLQAKYALVTIMFYSFLSGVIVLGIASPFEIAITHFSFSQISVVTIWQIAFLGIISSVLAFFLYQSGIKLTSPFIASLVFYVSPVAVTILAIIFLHETLTPTLILGSCFTFVGVFFGVVYAHIKKRAKAMLQ